MNQDLHLQLCSLVDMGIHLVSLFYFLVFVLSPDTASWDLNIVSRHNKQQYISLAEVQFGAGEEWQPSCHQSS